METLKGHKIAVLVANGFEQVELEKPKQALEEAGAEVFIISPEKEQVQGVHHMEKGDEFKVDVSLENANANDYTALLLPGGVFNPDELRNNKKAIEFIKEFKTQNKPIAAICHGPWLLINSDIAKGHKLTSWPSIKVDLINAGANWVDEQVVRDDKLITSRKPDDIPYFNQEMIKVMQSSQP